MSQLQFITNLFKRSKPVSDRLVFGEEVEKENRNIRLKDQGVFVYTARGFEVDLKKQYHLINWDAIERICVYKADLDYHGNLCMDIVYDNKTIFITQETWGWYQFIWKLKAALVLSDGNWQELVRNASFEYESITVYERADRIMPSDANFYSVIKTCTKSDLNQLFQQHGWLIRKTSFTHYEMRNSWAELDLDGDDDLLLHGLVAYHADNVQWLKRFFDGFGSGSHFEFYNEAGELLEEYNSAA